MSTCDFCSVARAQRTYPAAAFLMDTIVGPVETARLENVGPWLGCDDCSALIERDDLAGLVERALACFATIGPLPAPRRTVRELLTRQYRNVLPQLGPPVPLAEGAEAPARAVAATISSHRTWQQLGAHRLEERRN